MALHQLMAKVDEEAKGDSAGELGGSSLQGIAVTLVGEEGHEYCLDLSTGKSVVCTAITEGIIFFFFFSAQYLTHRWRLLLLLSLPGLRLSLSKANCLAPHSSIKWLVADVKGNTAGFVQKSTQSKAIQRAGQEEPSEGQVCKLHPLLLSQLRERRGERHTV